MTPNERAYCRYLSERHEASLNRQLHEIERPNGRQIVVDGHSYINFSSNDYLALNHHPALKDRAAKWLSAFGVGSGASRLVAGNLAQFSKLEAKIATQKGKEAALIMASGFQTNVSVLEALFDARILGSRPRVFADKLNHASMHLGCQAAGVKQIRYRHLDMDHLATLLERDKNDEEINFILTETVFSMDGDVAPLDTLAELAKAHNAILIADDAHGAGIFGPKGSGLGAYADIVIGTFSKAYGSFGAYVASSKNTIDYLVNRCSGLIYSTGLPPGILGAIDASLDLVPTMQSERTHISALAESFRHEVADMGFDTGASSSHIVPLIIGDANEALVLCHQLKQSGIWSTPIRPPTVPAGTARIRFSFCAAHTVEDVKSLLSALEQIQAGKLAQTVVNL